MNPKQRGWLLPPAAVLLIVGVFWGRSTPAILYAALGTGLCLPAVWLLRGRFRYSACLVLSLALGILAGSAAFHPSLPDEGDYEVRGIVSDEISFGDFGQVRVPLTSVRLNGRPFSGGAWWTFYTDETPADLLPGKETVFSASLYHPGGASNPGGYDFRESMLQRGILIGLYGADGLAVRDPETFSFRSWIPAFRHRLSVSLVEILGEEAGGYASALLLGQRSRIPSEDRRSFASLGIAHILSVSGFHVGILIGVLALVFRLLRLKQSLRLFLYALLLLFYSALCGMSIPVIRASLFLLLMTEGRILNRPRSGLHILCAVMYVMVLVSPVQVTSASFQLTFCAMMGLIWFTPLARRLNPFRRALARGFFESVVLTFGIQLCILLPELFFFQRLPLLGFLFNWPATLIASVLILLFWIVLLLLPVPGLARLLSGPLSWVTCRLLEEIRALGSQPGLALWLHAPNVLTAAGIILLLLGCCVFYRLSGKARSLLVILGVSAVAVSLLPLPHAATEYIQFSVGNADAAVLWDRDRVIVVDAGEDDGILSGYLRYNRLTPDAVILTHLHRDHAGGLRSMLDDEVPVPVLYLPEGAEEQQVHPDFLMLLDELRASGTEIRYLSRGDTMDLPSGSLAVLWPEKGRIRPGQDANNYSLVFRLTLRGTSLLQAGDVTGGYESYAAAPADILKASHHGSASSTSPAFLSAVSPRVVLLSCRRLDRLNSFREQCGEIPVYGTPESGAVTLRFEEGGFTVTPYKAPGLIGGR